MYKISLAAVNVPDEAYPLMQSALDQGKIGQTEFIEQFERAIAEYVHASYCVAVANGTMADAVAVAAMKIWMPNTRKVIVPALTFIAQPNSVRYNNLEVLFVDIKEDWTIDTSHIFGRVCHDSITFGTDLMGRQAFGGMEIEDACEAFGSKFQDRYAGTFGMLGTYSFFPSHTISTGEGGAIVTNNYDLAQLCRSIRAHGVGSTDAMEKFHFPRFGFNARMCSLQAVLGIALMKHINEYTSRRRSAFRLMQDKLGGFEEKPGEELVPHGYPIAYDGEESRDKAMLQLLDAGIECRKFFSCIPLEEPYYLTISRFPVAEYISHTHLYVPCHQNLSYEDVEYVVTQVEETKGRIIKKVSCPKQSQPRSEQMVEPTKT